MGGVDTLNRAPMSLKAKIEAVIYASEEPVTLVQLTGLLGEEGQAELDELDAQQHSLALEDESDDDAAIEPVEDADALNSEVTDSADEAETALDAAEAASELETTSAEAAVNGPSAADEKKLAKEIERKLRDYFRSLLDQLISDYANNDRGLEIREVAGGFRLATKPEYHDAVRGFVKSLKPPMKLSLQALETLAVVAYKQPVTAPEVSEIRGVDSAGVLGSLLTRKLVTTAGRKQVIGRPILYKTTKDFLVRFGLKDINELPSIEEFEKMAGELNEAVQEEIDMETPLGGSPSVDEGNAAPEPTHIHHDTPEDLMSDKSTHPEGVKHEHADPHEVEPMAEIHSDQADGTPEDE
jgi:segregation and condensation protein B